MFSLTLVGVVALGGGLATLYTGYKSNKSLENAVGMMIAGAVLALSGLGFLLVDYFWRIK